MRRQLILLAIFAVLAPLRAYAQSAPPRVISSIDIKVLNAGNVVVGQIAKAVPGPDGSVNISIAVDEVLKGDPQEARERHQERGQNGRFSVSEFSRMSRDKTRVLVIGPVFIPLYRNRLAIPTATGIILRDPDQTVAYVREVFRNHPGMNRVDVFNAPVPSYFQKIGFSGPFESGVAGPPRDMVVPVDSNLEKWAIETLRERPPSGNAPRAFDALKSFKSASNIELLKVLLEDSTFDPSPAEMNNGIEIRQYKLRQRSYELLKAWGVEVNEPVIREEIPRFSTLETVRWTGRPTDAELQRFVDAGKLQNLEITYAALPDSQVALIGRISSLVRLTLRGLTDANLTHFRDLKNLQEFDVGGTGKVTDEGLAELSGLPRLTRLVLASTRVTDYGLTALTRFPSLKSVDLTLTQTTRDGLAQARKLRPDLVIEREAWYWTVSSPFAAAAFRGDIGAIRKFIGMGAHGSDSGGTPAIIYAVGQDHFGIVKLLLDNKTRVDIQDVGKNTPLHWAAHHGHDRIMKLLLDRGANLNRSDAAGYTALHFAARNGKPELVQVLLAAGANPSAKTNGGLTPLDLARRYGRESARTQLLEFSGRGSIDPR